MNIQAEKEQSKFEQVNRSLLLSCFWFSLLLTPMNHFFSTSLALYSFLFSLVFFFLSHLLTLFSPFSCLVLNLVPIFHQITPSLLLIILLRKLCQTRNCNEYLLIFFQRIDRNLFFSTYFSTDLLLCPVTDWTYWQLGCNRLNRRLDALSHRKLTGQSVRSISSFCTWLFKQISGHFYLKIDKSAPIILI